MKKILIGVVSLVVILIVALLLIFSPPKLKNFIAFTDLKFPEKTKMIDSIDQEYLSGNIQIPIESIELFLKENQFYNRTDQDIYSHSACVHNGLHRYELKLNLKTGEMHINVFYPDPAGTKPCDPTK